MRHGFGHMLRTYGAIALGGAVFAFGFNWFLLPNSISAGGLSGLSLILVKVLKFGSVGLLTAVMNVPLFFLGWRRLGRQFLLRSLAGMAFSTLFLELFALLPPPDTEPLLGALAGGILSGAGLGLVFTRGGTTGGVDLIARLLKRKFPALSMGRLMFLADLFVVALTGIAFGDLNKALYSALTLYTCSIVVDKLLYGPDVSAVALIVSEQYAAIADAIHEELSRGVTVLPAQGWHTGKERPMLLSAVRKGQIAALKRLVHRVDADAFVILQEAHQVLGMGFRRYSGEEDG